MAKTDFQSVDEYIAAQPAELRPRLQAVRGWLQAAMPDAVESISYQIPTYKLNGKAVLFFAGWKTHLSLYPTTPALLHAHGAELAPYRANKDTLHFAWAQPLPQRLLQRIARFRAREAQEPASGKPASGKKKATRAQSTGTRRSRGS